MTYESRAKDTWRFQQGRAFVVSLVALIGSLSAPTPAYTQCGELSWLEAINQALEANQALASARRTLEAQHKDVAIARSTMLPTIGGGGLAQISKDQTFSSQAGVIPERTTKVAGEITETLYDQADIDALGAQKHVYKGQQETFANTRNQTIAEAGQDYISLLLAEALMALQQENVDLTQGSLDLTQAQLSSGEVPYSNLLRMRSQLYEAQQELLSQKSSLLASRFGFNQVRNRPTEEVCRLEKLTVERDGFVFSSEVVVDAMSEEQGASAIRDFLVALGLKRSPVLRSLDAQIRADWRTMKSGRRWLIPSLDATAAAAVFVQTGGEGSSTTQSGERFWQVGLQLNWNLLEGGSYIATMNQSKAEFWSLKFQRTNTATALEEDIRATAVTAMVTFEQIALAVLQQEAANENYALVSEQYLDGESPLLNLIDAQEELIDANTSARQALYQFLSDLLTLEQSIAYYPFFEDDADALVRDLEKELR